MTIIEKLPWYSDYIYILEECRIAEKEIEDLENPEKQLQRVKKFYKNLGADCTKNNWFAEAEKNISFSNKGENSRLNQLKRDVKFGISLENAIQKQDKESISALNVYMNDERYEQLIRKVMFYIGVSKVKEEPDFIKRAYDGIKNKYSFNNIVTFTEEGVYYYIYYFQCLQILFKKYKGRSSYNDIRSQIKDRCYNAKLMFNSYQTDMYLADETKLVLAEITETEDMISNEMDD